MATEYQTVCAERLEAHEHITHVGTGTVAQTATKRWTVHAVRTALENGDRFYTVSPSTDRVADVRAYDAVIDGRRVETIRSAGDAIEDNNPRQHPRLPLEEVLTLGEQRGHAWKGMARVRAFPFTAWVCRVSGRHGNRVRKEWHEPLGLGNRQHQPEPTIQREIHLATI
jgi:hypothetical protein